MLSRVIAASLMMQNERLGVRFEMDSKGEETHLKVSPSLLH
jgi:hypothetical protein